MPESATGRMVLDERAATALLKDASACGDMGNVYRNLYAAYPDEESRAALAAAAAAVRQELETGSEPAEPAAAAQDVERRSAPRPGPLSPATGDTRMAAAAEKSCQAPFVRPVPGSFAPSIKALPPAELTASVDADSQSSAWKDPAVRGPEFAVRAEMAATAVLSGAATGAGQGAVSGLLVLAAAKAGSRVPFFGGLVESVVIASDPQGWLDGLAASTIGAGQRAVADMKQPGFAAKLEAVLSGIGIATAVTGTLATVCQIVAAALLVGGVLLLAAGAGTALLSAVPLFAKAGLVLGGVSALFAMGQGAIRASLVGLSALDLLAGDGNDEQTAARAAALQSHTAGFLRSVVAAKTVRAGLAVQSAPSTDRTGPAGAIPAPTGLPKAESVRTRLAATVLDLARVRAERDRVREGHTAIRESNPDIEEQAVMSSRIGEGSRRSVLSAADTAIGNVRAVLADAAASMPGSPFADETEVERSAAAWRAAVESAEKAERVRVEAESAVLVWSDESSAVSKLQSENEASSRLAFEIGTEIANRNAAAAKGSLDAAALASSSTAVDSAPVELDVLSALARVLGLVPGAICRGAAEASKNTAAVAETVSSVRQSGLEASSRAETWKSWFDGSAEVLSAGGCVAEKSSSEAASAAAELDLARDECAAGLDSFESLAREAAAARDLCMAEAEQEFSKSMDARTRLAEWAATASAQSDAAAASADLFIDEATVCIAEESTAID